MDVIFFRSKQLYWCCEEPLIALDWSGCIVARLKKFRRASGDENGR